MRGYNPVEGMKSNKPQPSSLQVYHGRYWKPLSDAVDRVVSRVKILRVIKRCFDVHFSIFGVLGIFATPPSDIDCYLYMWDRTNPHKYSHLSWHQRRRLLMALFREIKDA